MDDNLSEFELRRQVVGRANWTLAGSDDGAEWNAIATSIVASCKLHDIEPWAYLRDVLTLLPTWPKAHVSVASPRPRASTTRRGTRAGHHPSPR